MVVCCGWSPSGVSAITTLQLLLLSCTIALRLLHVATNSRANVDAISSISNTDGTYGPGTPKLSFNDESLQSIILF